MTALYAIIDPAACVHHAPLLVAEGALRGGATILHLRAKSLSDRDRLDLAKRLSVLTKAHAASFVMNDRVDLALLADADEVHLGQGDLSIAEARQLAPKLRIGRSTHDFVQLRQAADEGADRLAFGPLFDTQSKANPEKTVGLEAFFQAQAELGKPLIAIGGIDVDRARGLAHRGLAAVAVISAICGAREPESAALSLVEALV